MKSLGKSGIIVGLLAGVMLMWSGNANALNHLQIYIPGGTYVGAPEESTFYEHIPGTSFAVQVFAKESLNSTDKVYLSFALDNTVFGETDSIAGVSILANSQTFSGAVPGDFVWGNPFSGEPGGAHGIFDAHYAKIELTKTDFVYGDDSIFDVQDGSSVKDGYTATVNVTINDFFSVHYDAWGTIDGHSRFAPFSHDGEATPVPEPATIALLSMGFVGMLGYKGKRFLKKS